MSEATALKRTGAMALACGGQVTKMTGGMPAALSSSMMTSEPFTCALARVVIVCGNPYVGLPDAGPD